jgi:3-phenylpropionate/cinnamic acid dioxygenase small subunit
MATEADPTLRRLLLKQEIEEFLLAEADLLDARRFEDWLALFTDDVRYYMPLARNLPAAGLADEFGAEGRDASWIDEGLETLRQRVAQLSTGVHWAEQPPSRTTHMISNLALTAVRPEAGTAEEVESRCRFLVYRNRLETEEYFYVGKRNDSLRRVDGRWRISRREIYLDQNVLLAKNLSVFF